MKFSTFNWADYTVIALMLASVLISLIRGFVREAISLATWIIAFWIALTFVDQLAVMLTNYIHTPVVRMASAFFILFVATLILGALVNFIIAQLVHKTGLSGTDRFLGVVFGLGRGALLIALLILVVSLSKVPEESWWQESALIPVFKPLAVWIKQFLPETLEFKMG